MAKIHREDNARQAAVAGRLIAESLWRRAIGNKLLARKRAPSGRILSNQWCAIIASLLYLCRQEAIGKACRVWKYSCAQKCLQCLKRLQSAEVPAVPGKTAGERKPLAESCGASVLRATNEFGMGRMKSEILNENPEQVTSTKERLVKCVKEVLPSTTKTCIWLLKITLGVSVLILFMRYFKILPWLSATLGPLFNHFGLPGEAALAYVSGYFVNMYAMLAIAGSMDLTARAITILGVMSLCSHNMITETAVQGKTGANPVRVVITRTLAGFVLAFVLNLILPLSQSDIAMLGGAVGESEAAVASVAEAPTGVASAAGAPATVASVAEAPAGVTSVAETAPAAVASLTEAPAAVQPLFKELAVEWCYSTLSILVKMTLLIYSLAILQRILSEFGVIRWVSKFLKPLLLLFGLPARCSFLWIIANILGIAYGGAVMMEEVRAGKLSLRDIKLVNQHIGISHSNLEDLTLVASIGGIWWVMLLSRWAGSFILVWGYRAEMAIRKKLLTLQTKTTL